MDQITIDRALLGDPEASKACTEAGVAIPCPFCGGSDIEIDEHIAQCVACDAWGDVYKSKAEALSAWNRRADLRGIAGGDT